MKTWINNLKIALIEENGDKLINLSHNIPKTNDIALAKEACVLMQEAIKFAELQKLYLTQQISQTLKG